MPFWQNDMAQAGWAKLALAMPMNVFASALSPALMGILIDLHFQLDDIILLLAV